MPSLQRMGVHYYPHITEVRALTECAVWATSIMTYTVLRALLRLGETGIGDEMTSPTPLHGSVTDYTATYTKGYTCAAIRQDRRIGC
jgi:hypothetical protein